MKTITAILLSLAAFSANATTLYAETSVRGESMDEFVVRIADRAYDHTKKSGHEVCGAIREEGGIFTVVITTSGRNDECELPGDTEVYVHTHPINQGFHFSKGDYVRPGYLIAQNVIKFQNGGRPRKVSSR